MMTYAGLHGNMQMSGIKSPGGNKSDYEDSYKPFGPSSNRGDAMTNECDETIQGVIDAAIDKAKTEGTTFFIDPTGKYLLLY